MLVAITMTTLPALRTASVEAAESLRTRERGNSRGSRGQWLKHALLIGQIAITTIVLSTAALMLSSLERMRRLDVGLAPQDVLLGELDLPSFRRSEPAAIQQELMRIAEHAATLPGVRYASAVQSAPFAGTQGVDATVFAEGQTTVDTANPIVNYEGVDASYFDTIGLPVLRGRGIDRRDREGSQPVVVVNETFARTFWPGADPIGRRIKWGSAQSDSPWFTVVGLVADARYRELTFVRPSVYVPYAHGIPVTPGYVAVRAEKPGAAAEALRRAVSDLAPGATVVRIDPLPQLLAAPLARPRFQTTLASFFATLALLLSLIGIYGVLSFAVRQRRREIGIRIALGATPSRVRRLVLSQAIVIGVLGVLPGVAGAFAVGRFVEPLLFGVTATEPLVVSSAAACCFLSVVLAAFLPTRSATRTDPLLVLRSE
jgi:putative ABC transport system permease protein